MTATEDTDALAIAYLEGELDPSAARAFEARLAADPSLRAEVDGLRAMKELLGEDARFGEASKVDAPPAHLVHAILQAEALARPASIRDAAALQKSPSPSLTARMARWLLGGGALVAGAAALVLVMKTSSAPESMVLGGDAVATTAAPAVSEAAPRAQRPAQEPSAADAGGWAPAREDGLGRARAGRPAAPEASGAKLDALTSSAPAPEAKRAAVTADAPPPPQEPPADGALGVAKDARDSKPTGGLAKAAQPGATMLADEEAPAFAESATRRAQGEGARAEPPARSSAGGVTSGAVSRGFDDGDSVAQGAGAPATLSIEEARKELYERRVADKSAAKKRSANDVAKESARESAKRLAEAESKAKTKAAPKAEVATPAPAKPVELQRPDDLRMAQEADAAFHTGLRELQAKRYLEALAAFENADLLDRKSKAFGVSPVVGQMRCYAALGRTADVARLAPRVLHAKLNAPDAAEGIALGADAAEKVGDTFLAEQLWRRLLDSPPHKVVAQRALERLKRPMRNKAVDASEAPAEPAAAAAPPDAK